MSSSARTACLALTFLLLPVFACSSESTSPLQRAPVDSGAPALSVSPTTKSVILSLTAIAENSQTSLKYDYAENIGDGRGITFGIIGFTSGTYDGTMLIRHVGELDPGNALVSYLPALEAIDALPHNDEGMTDSVAGLEGFIADFQAHGAEPKVKTAQMDKLNELYWDPAVAEARKLGALLSITVGQLYDASVLHGVDGDAVDQGLVQLVAQATERAGGTPGTGVDEREWLAAFMAVRGDYMLQDAVWKESIDRVEMYKRILATGNTGLTPPLKVTCYGDAFAIAGTENP